MRNPKSWETTVVSKCPSIQLRGKTKVDTISKEATFTHGNIESFRC